MVIIALFKVTVAWLFVRLHHILDLCSLALYFVEKYNCIHACIQRYEHHQNLNVYYFNYKISYI